MFCTHCGKRNADTANFCYECGTGLSSERPTAIAASPPVHSDSLPLSLKVIAITFLASSAESVGR
jgi:uncharacterized membrane protein YvbJ